MASDTLTRGDAQNMVDIRRGDMTSLTELLVEWTGNDSAADDKSPAELADFLHEYVSEMCMDVDGDSIRSNGPKDSDDSGIPR